jgi:hypothetical protein
MKNPRKRTPRQKFDFFWQIWAETTLSLAAKGVATTLLLQFHNAKTSRCNPSIVSIAKTAGISRRAVFNAIAELKDAGWIAIDSTRGGSSSHTNKYSFDFGCMKPTASPTGANGAPHTGAKSARVHEMPPRGAQNAHEPLRTTHPSGVGGEGEQISPHRAPDGAAAEFEELRQLWQRPHGMNVPKALAAFNRVTGDGEVASAIILESARRWVAAREPAFLPALERRLDDGAWRNDPPTQRSNSHRKPSAAEEAANLAREAERNGR